MSTRAHPRPREIRVFLSSTFKDMEAERSYLLKHVFPKVRAACQARQVGFTEIDLRWGVTEEDSKNGATVEICLAEIDRCRDFPPFFIGFLGERYGWIPKENDLAAYWQKHAASPYSAPIRQAVARGISVTELEMELAVLAPGAAERIAEHALFLLRDRALTDTLYTAQTGQSVQPDRNAAPTDPAFYDSAHGRLDQLKTRIRQSGFLGIDGYTSVEQFGQAIETYLLAELDRHFPEVEIPTPEERQNQAHATFRYHRLQNFLPRVDVRQHLLAALEQRILQPHLGPILLTGPSGQGKSALMADLARYLESGAGHPEGIHYRVFDHYFGADAATGSLDAWVERVLQHLHPEIADWVGNEIPKNPKDQHEAFSTWVAYAARRMEQNFASCGEKVKVRFVFLLDALDQASGGSLNEILQASTLGPDSLVIASAADGTPALDQVQGFERMAVPPLTAALRRQIIDRTLARYKKGLAPELITQLADAEQSKSPLFLMLALEELRLDARHETLAHTLSQILTQPDAQNLFLHAFLLDPDYSRPEQPDLAAKFMAMIGAAYAGLTEQELADLLALPTDPVAENTGQPRLPTVHLSKLMTAFGPWLIDKGGKRAPMHRVFGAVALASSGEHAIREQLYSYFSPGYGRETGTVEVWGAAEALYQITCMARGDDTQRKRLEGDLACLPVPATLYNEAEVVLLKALGEFTYEQKTALATRWEEQVTPLAEGDIEGIGKAISGYANWLRKKIGHYAAARCLKEPLLEAHRRLLGDEHPATLWTMSDLASTLGEQGDLPGARAMQDTLLEARRRILGDEHPYTLTAIANLAVTLRAQGDLPGARALEERVLEAFRRILGDEDPLTLKAMNNLALTLGDQGDLPGARAMQEQVFEARRRILGNEHPDTLMAMNNLAATLGDQGDRTGAQAKQEQVLKVFRHILGDEHPDTLMAMNNLALTLGDQGDLPGARALGERVLAIRENIHGPNSPQVGTVLYRLGSLLGQMGKLEEAESILRRELEIAVRHTGEDGPGTITSLETIGNLLEAKEDIDGLLEIRQRQIAALERTVGPDDEQTIRVLQNFAVYLRNAGKLDEAEPLQREALARCVTKFGKDHIEITASLTDLGALLTAKGAWEEADQHLVQALAIRERELGPEAPPTVTVRERLVELSFSRNATGPDAKGRITKEDVDTTGCIACRAQIVVNAKFCTECGAPQQQACSNCLTVLSGNAKFCTECGQPAMHSG